MPATSCLGMLEMGGVDRLSDNAGKLDDTVDHFVAGVESLSARSGSQLSPLGVGGAEKEEKRFSFNEY